MEQPQGASIELVLPVSGRNELCPGASEQEAGRASLPKKHGEGVRAFKSETQHAGLRWDGDAGHLSWCLHQSPSSPSFPGL